LSVGHIVLGIAVVGECRDTPEGERAFPVRFSEHYTRRYVCPVQSGRGCRANVRS
jgi:hypothetical protein